MSPAPPPSATSDEKPPASPGKPLPGAETRSKRVLDDEEVQFVAAKPVKKCRHSSPQHFEFGSDVAKQEESGEPSDPGSRHFESGFLQSRVLVLARMQAS